MRFNFVASWPEGNINYIFLPGWRNSQVSEGRKEGNLYITRMTASPTSAPTAIPSRMSNR